jgi:large subunit ribosomal protein L24
LKIRKNDNVVVIAGKDKGKRGKVRYAYPKEERLLVEGINMIKRHTKAKGESQKGGIIEREASIAIADVMLVCTRCKKPSRIGFKILGDGRKTRVCLSCNEVVD